MVIKSASEIEVGENYDGGARWGISDVKGDEIRGILESQTSAR